MDNNHARATKTSICGLKSTLTTDSALSANFNINELESALKSVKPRTAAGFDPESTHNCGERTKEWLIAFMNDVLSPARLPTLFKKAKINAIPKPGKDGSDPPHCRPISLLSVMYSSSERMILQHIQPLIEAASAEFRKHCSCTEHVIAFATQIEAGFQRQLNTGIVFIDLSTA
jgi:hypothetical protein